MQLSFYDGELDLYDSLSACDPPVWRLVWVALCMAKGKAIPSICRACGKLIDRRNERRSKTVSCNERTRSCTAAFNNNGKRRMIKRREWGRSFIPDEHFSYIAEYRESVLETLAKQKANPNWPPYTMGLYDSHRELALRGCIRRDADNARPYRDHDCPARTRSDKEQT